MLLTHILNTAAAIKKPPTIPLGFKPRIPINPNAIRRCNSQRSMAMAIRNPPRKRKTIGLAYGAATDLISPNPSRGINTSGNSAVAGIGIVSAIHHVAISAATPAVIQAATVMPSGGGNTQVVNKANGPTKAPIFCRLPNFDGAPVWDGIGVWGMSII